VEEVFGAPVPEQVLRALLNRRRMTRLEEGIVRWIVCHSLIGFGPGASSVSLSYRKFLVRRLMMERIAIVKYAEILWRSLGAD
jgi:hypothetical protein